MPQASQSKPQLRSELRQQRLSLPQQQQQQAAQALPGYVAGIPIWHRAQRVALYLAADGEIDTTPLAQAARDAGKQLFLPTIHPDQRLSFALWEKNSDLIHNQYGIPEPPPGSELCAPEVLDIIFLPLVAWDKSGQRLGMGGGFYDRTLNGVEGPLRVGLAHTLQQVSQLPKDPWDVTLNFVATDTALHCCPGG